MSSPILELKDTIELMTSDDYRDRLEAELLQLTIRRRKLIDILSNWNHLDFIPNCPYEILAVQVNIMGSYLAILEARRSLYEKE